MDYEFLAAFDSGDQTADRYRVVFEYTGALDDEEEDRPRLAFLMSDDANMPNGEIRIARESLPEGTRRAIRRIEAYETLER